MLRALFGGTETPPLYFGRLSAGIAGRDQHFSTRALAAVPQVTTPVRRDHGLSTSVPNGIAPGGPYTWGDPVLLPL